MFFVYFWFNIVVICAAGVLQEICAQNLALSGEKSVLWALYPTCQVLALKYHANRTQDPTTRTLTLMIFKCIACMRGL